LVVAWLLLLQKNLAILLICAAGTVHGGVDVDDGLSKQSIRDYRQSGLCRLHDAHGLCCSGHVVA
jgi:hypothetical protein